MSPKCCMVQVWIACIPMKSSHQMETFSALLAICAGNSPVTGEFSAQRPVTRNFDVFFDLGLNKRLSKQSWGRWFETPLRPLWRHCNDCDFFIGSAIYLACQFIFLHYFHEYLHCATNKHTCRGPFYYYGLTIIPIWISNHVSSKVTKLFIHTQTSMVQPLKFGIDK